MGFGSNKNPWSPNTTSQLKSQFLFAFSGSNRLFFEERHIVPHKKVVLLRLRPLIVTIGISSLFFNLALVSIWNVSIANLQCRFRRFKILRDDFNYLCHVGDYISSVSWIQLPRKMRLHSQCSWHRDCKTGQLIREPDVHFVPGHSLQHWQLCSLDVEREMVDGWIV